MKAILNINYWEYIALNIIISLLLFEMLFKGENCIYYIPKVLFLIAILFTFPFKGAYHDCLITWIGTV